MRLGLHKECQTNMKIKENLLRTIATVLRSVTQVLKAPQAEVLEKRRRVAISTYAGIQNDPPNAPGTASGATPQLRNFLNAEDVRESGLLADDTATNAAAAPRTPSP